MNSKAPQREAQGNSDEPLVRDDGDPKKIQEAAGKGTLIEQAETRTAQANRRADQANTRTNDANTRTDQANTRTGEANTRADEANTRTAQANARTEQVELRFEKEMSQKEVLRASELSYRRLFEAARDGILILDYDTGRVADVNPYLVELLGFSHGEMVGKTVGELSPFADVVANQGMLERLQKEGFVRYDDLPLETRDGRHIDVEFVSNVYQSGATKVIQCNIRNITERKRVEASLRVSENRFRTVLETMSLIGVMLDQSGRITLCNDFLLALTGWKREEVMNQNWFELFLQPEIRESIEKEIFLKTISAGEVPVHFENEIITRDGKRRLILWNNTILRDPNGSVVGVASIGEDITEQKQVEVTLREREERLRLAMGAANMGTWDRDLTTNALHWSETEELLMGYAPGAFPGTNEAFMELVHPESVAVLLAAQQRVRTGDGVLYAEVHFRCRDGRQRWGLLCGKKILDESGRAVRIVGVDMDITERKRAEDSHARLSMAVDQSAETIVITDTDGTIVYVNPAFEKTTGYRCDEALGQNPRILKSGKQDDAFYRKMWEILERGEVWSGHIVNRRKDGQIYEEEATISPIRDAAGKVVNYVAVKRDVTREVQLESQLRQTQKMESIGQLAGGIAHDFNNILAVLMMQTDFLATIENTPAEVREGLREISTATARAANLTRQLLLFSRQEVMQLRHLDLNEVVTSLAKLLQRIIREDVHLQLHLHSAPLLTYADAGMLDQLLINLAVNARDAMPKGGRLIIETAEKVIAPEQAGLNAEASPGRFAWLSVSDSGCGMSPEIQSRIFEPFFTTKEVGQGTGLGLATVFGIVKQHHGWLKVYSEVGKGTTFQVFLPVSDVSPEEALVKDRTKNKPRGGSETILVVEDNEAVRILTRRMLERSGYHVLEAADGVAAQKIWNEHQSRIALLLTDLVMPGGLDGRELAALLQRQNPALKIILTSGYSADIAGRELALKAGQNFLQKPCPPDQLLTAVRNCLDG